MNGRAQTWAEALSKEERFESQTTSGSEVVKRPDVLRMVCHTGQLDVVPNVASVFNCFLVTRMVQV